MAEIKTPYLNLQTDFGFKFVFGTIDNKQALVRFLNALFEGKLTVTDISYHDKEVLPSEEKGKRIVYDVYCTTPIKRRESSYFTPYQSRESQGEVTTDHHFILEMQNIYTPPFEERITYYASKMIAGQGKAGWDYNLEPVFAVAVMDFNFSHMSNKLVRDVILADRDTKEPLTEKVHIVLCSLKELPEKWESCRTEIEQALFLIKNMDKMDNTSLAYREGKFAEIFDAARSNRLREDEKVAYSNSLEKLRDTQKGILFAADRAREEGKEAGFAAGREEGLAVGREEGLVAGREEGLAAGLAEGKKAIVRSMKLYGMSDEEIANITKLSIDVVKRM